MKVKYNEFMMQFLKENASNSFRLKETVDAYAEYDPTLGGTAFDENGDFDDNIFADRKNQLYNQGSRAFDLRSGGERKMLLLGLFKVPSTKPVKVSYDPDIAKTMIHGCEIAMKKLESEKSVQDEPETQVKTVSLTTTVTIIINDNEPIIVDSNKNVTVIINVT